MTKKCKPILFGTPMVQAILEGRKTQTRRIIKKQPDPTHIYLSKAVVLDGTNRICLNYSCGNSLRVDSVFPKYQVGDILWVRETWRKVNHYGFDYEFVQYKAGSTNAHCEIADPDQLLHDDKWKPSIFMPKKACRNFLEVTNVRFESLQNISEEDALAEGIEIIDNERYGRVFRHYQMGNQEHYFKVPELSFKSLWESINGQDSWEVNPWVWVYEFKRVEKPKDF